MAATSTMIPPTVPGRSRRTQIKLGGFGDKSGHHWGLVIH